MLVLDVERGVRHVHRHFSGFEWEQSIRLITVLVDILNFLFCTARRFGSELFGQLFRLVFVGILAFFQILFWLRSNTLDHECVKYSTPHSRFLLCFLPGVLLPFEVAASHLFFLRTFDIGPANHFLFVQFSDLDRDKAQHIFELYVLGSMKRDVSVRSTGQAHNSVQFLYFVVEFLRDLRILISLSRVIAAAVDVAEIEGTARGVAIAWL